jgi:hypothetical protein
MPVNAPPEYYRAEEKFKNSKSKDDKIAALEEMIRLMPKHHGSEAALAQLKSRLAKLKKESIAKGRGGSRASATIVKEGDAQVCLVGLTNSGKSFLLKELTDAEPVVAEHPYTTTKTEVGMMDYKGIKIQLVEIPSTFLPEYMAIVRTSDRVALVIKNEGDKDKLLQLLESNFIRAKSLFVNPWGEDAESIKERIWKSLGMIIVYSKKTSTPMALPIGSTVKEFCKRIHKDFVKNFRFARVWRNSRQTQAGLEYRLQDNDVVEIYTK